MERYGSCMASVRWHIEGIVHLRREELGSLLMAIKEGESNAESTMRVTKGIMSALKNLNTGDSYPRPIYSTGDHLN